MFVMDTFQRASRGRGDSRLFYLVNSALTVLDVAKTSAQPLNFFDGPHSSSTAINDPSAQPQSLRWLRPREVLQATEKCALKCKSSLTTAFVRYHPYSKATCQRPAQVQKAFSVGRRKRRAMSVSTSDRNWKRPRLRLETEILRCRPKKGPEHKKTENLRCTPAPEHKETESLRRTPKKPPEHREFENLRCTPAPEHKETESLRRTLKKAPEHKEFEKLRCTPAPEHKETESLRCTPASEHKRVPAKEIKIAKTLWRFPKLKGGGFSIRNLAQKLWWPRGASNKSLGQNKISVSDLRNRSNSMTASVDIPHTRRHSPVERSTSLNLNGMKVEEKRATLFDQIYHLAETLLNAHTPLVTLTPSKLLARISCFQAFFTKGGALAKIVTEFAQSEEATLAELLQLRKVLCKLVTRALDARSAASSHITVPKTLHSSDIDHLFGEIDAAICFFRLTARKARSPTAEEYKRRRYVSCSSDPASTASPFNFCSSLSPIPCKSSHCSNPLCVISRCIDSLQYAPLAGKACCEYKQDHYHRCRGLFEEFKGGLFVSALEKDSVSYNILESLFPQISMAICSFEEHAINSKSCPSKCNRFIDVNNLVSDHFEEFKFFASILRSGKTFKEPEQKARRLLSSFNDNKQEDDMVVPKWDWFECRADDLAQTSALLALCGSEDKIYELFEIAKERLEQLLSHKMESTSYERTEEVVEIVLDFLIDSTLHLNKLYAKGEINPYWVAKMLKNICLIDKKARGLVAKILLFNNYGFLIREDVVRQCLGAWICQEHYKSHFASLSIAKLKMALMKSSAQRGQAAAICQCGVDALILTVVTESLEAWFQSPDHVPIAVNRYLAQYIYQCCATTKQKRRRKESEKNRHSAEF